MSTVESKVYTLPYLTVSYCRSSYVFSDVEFLLVLVRLLLLLPKETMRPTSSATRLVGAQLVVQRGTRKHPLSYQKKENTPYSIFAYHA